MDFLLTIPDNTTSKNKDLSSRIILILCRCIKDLTDVSETISWQTKQLWSSVELQKMTEFVRNFTYERGKSMC
jgi:hypothetical protein